MSIRLTLSVELYRHAMTSAVKSSDRQTDTTGLRKLVVEIPTRKEKKWMLPFFIVSSLMQSWDLLVQTSLFTEIVSYCNRKRRLDISFSMLNVIK